MKHIFKKCLADLPKKYFMKQGILYYLSIIDRSFCSMKGDWEMFQLKNINGAYLDLDLLKPMLTYGNMLQWYFEDEQKHTK